MLTLLFAVFVVLFALKQGGAPETNKAAGSLQESFNTPLEDIPIDRRVGPAEQGFGIFEHLKGDQIRAPLIQKFPSANKESIAVIDSEMQRFKLKLEERLYGPDRVRPADKGDKGYERVVSVERTTKGFKLRLTARYFFEPGSTNVKREAIPELDKIIEVLKSLGKDITVEGHTDSIPPKGDLSNWEISTLRATSIVRYMIRQHDFPQTRLSAVGYADLRPIAHNGTEEGRALNRRIEFHVHLE